VNNYTEGDERNESPRTGNERSGRCEGIQ